MTPLLILGFLIPSTVMAGGDKGRDPYDIGERYFAQKEYRRAMQYYRKALTANDIRAHYRMGLIYEEQGKERDALKHYRRYMELGRPGSEWNDSAARVKRIEERLQAETARSAALFERGKALYQEGKFKEAEGVFLDALKEDEANPDIHFYLGEVYLQLGEYGKAEAEFRKAKEYY
jgi:tetratricopeptide (TPR) repeat protein